MVYVIWLMQYGLCNMVNATWFMLYG